MKKIALLLATIFSGCSTTVIAISAGPFPFGGVLVDSCLVMGESPIGESDIELWLRVLALIDWPLSLAADIGLLPISLIWMLVGDPGY